MFKYLLGSLLISSQILMAAPKGYNYTEANVPNFELPKLLENDQGKPIKTVDEWETTRRPEILSTFKEEVFGYVPKKAYDMSFKVVSSEPALNGVAIRKQVKLTFKNEQSQSEVNLLIYLPVNSQKNTPTFLCTNFNGNHTINSDPGIVITKAWVRNRKDMGTTNNQASEKSRGVASSRWPVEMILKQGYALSTVYYGDVDPDTHDNFKNGIHPLLDGQQRPKNAWGSISAWSWGLSRIMDYFETDPQINHKKVAVFGHSRLGKTSLWTGATDQRFALVISNNSGCGGAALSRRHFGETVQRINTSFPHWFNDNYKKYNENENACPIDQHMLIALIAPRPVYVVSAVEDIWADPRGEFLSAKYGSEVYQLYGKKHILNESMPELEKPLMTQVGYHIRHGKHDVKDYDWENYLKFADMHLK